MLAAGLASGSSFRHNTADYLIYTAVGLIVSACTLGIARRQHALAKHGEELGVIVESRAIRDAVEESLTGSRRRNYVRREIARAQRYGRDLGAC